MPIRSLVPREVFFTKGVGTHKNRLQSFEMALRVAGIAPCNLVKVSSILPPHCTVIPKTKGVKKLQAGQILFVILSEAATNEPSRLVGAGVGLAQPADRNRYGYISEHHAFGMTEAKMSDLVEDMAATMLATTLGIEFDPDSDYDERRDLYKMSGKIVRSRSVVQTAEGHKEGLWTTVMAAAVLLF